MCCSKMNIAHETLNWVHGYNKIFKEVGYIYKVYCNERCLTENQCIIIEEIPPEVARNPNEDVQR